MTKLKITLASALIVAGVALPLWQESRLRRLAAESEALRAEAAALPALRAQVQRLKAAEASRAELERMRAANADLRLEVARLRGLARPAVGLAAAAGTAPDTNRLPAALGGMVKGVLEQQVTGKLARMKSKLNLTAEQEGAIRAALTHQVEKSAEAAQKMLLGKLSKEEMQGLRADHVNPEDQIKAVLTPEQLALYEEFQQEEHVANARLVANAELLQMQGSLGLTPEQQDQVFNALYDYTVRQLKGELTNDLPKNAGVAAAVAWQVDQKVKALAGVLTPEQLASYRQIQEQQTTMLKAFMPEEAGGK